MHAEHEEHSVGDDIYPAAATGVTTATDATLDTVATAATTATAATASVATATAAVSRGGVTGGFSPQCGGGRASSSPGDGGVFLYTGDDKA